MNLMGDTFVHLFENLDELGLLRSDRSTESNAIEELIRFETPVSYTGRVAGEPLGPAGIYAPSGSVIPLCLGALKPGPGEVGTRCR
jgi:cytochrome P450